MFKGSLYGQWEAIVTFTVMIVLADQHGEVDMTPQALSAQTSIPLDIIKRGIRLLEAPDPKSRTPDEEGRRIVRVSDDRDWGWMITNYAHYRAIRSLEERREYMRQYQRERRQKLKPVNTVNTASTPVNNVTHAVSSKQEAGSRKQGTTSAQKAAPCEGEFSEVWNLYPKRYGGNSRSDALRVFSARVREGVPVDVLRAGVERYAAFCAATEKIKTEKVMQTTRFFGPGKYWEESWDIPALSNGLGKPEQRPSDDTDFVAASTKLLNLVGKRDPLHSHTLTPDGWALLDAKERASLKVIGGIDRVLTAKPSEWQWVVRDFLKAQRGAAA